MSFRKTTFLPSRLHQPLLDQPLLPADQCLAHVPAETVVGTLLVHLSGELTVEPSRALGADLPARSARWTGCQ